MNNRYHFDASLPRSIMEKSIYCEFIGDAGTQQFRNISTYEEIVKEYNIFDKKPIFNSKQIFDEIYTDFDYNFYKKKYLNSQEVSDEYIYKHYLIIGKKNKYLKNNKKLVIIYTRPIDVNCGGVVVLHNLAKLINDLNDETVYAKLFVYNGLTYYNTFCNEFATLDDINDNCVVVYPEGIKGNPLNAKNVVRWILLGLGKEMPNNHFINWGKKDLVYYYNYERKFELVENIEKVGTIFKTLNTVYINPHIKNLNFDTRDEFCHAFRKAANFNLPYTPFHPDNSFEITREHNQMDCVTIFNRCKIFICYDHLTFLIVISVLCGCVAVVNKVDGLTKEEWLKTSSAYEFIKKSGVNNLYGIAYGMEDLQFALDTLHLAKQQWINIMSYSKNVLTLSFINDIKNIENVENTVENIFLIRNIQYFRNITYYNMEHGKKIWYAPNKKEAYGEREITAVVECLNDGWLAGFGPRTIEFEKKVSDLFGKKFGLFVNSGSSAILLGLNALNLSADDEVITPACTFSTTLAPVIQCGLKPIFCDVEIGTYVPTAEQVYEKVTDKTKVILIPNLIGSKPDWAKIREKVGPNIILFEDSADTITFTPDTDIAITSFYSSHLITAAGSGGMVMFNDEKFLKRATMFRDWGRIGDNSEDVKTRFEFSIDGIPYDYKFLYGAVGYNMKSSELNAAFGLVQIDRLEEIREKRQKVFNRYLENLQDLTDKLVLPINIFNSDWLAIPFMTPRRLELLTFLEENNIQTRVCFAGNVTRHPVYREYLEVFPNSDRIMAEGFLLGAHHGMVVEDVDYVCSKIREFFNK